MSESGTIAAKTQTDGTFAFFGLACGITWLLSLPLALHPRERAEPAPWAVGMAGLSAFGPTIAAVLVAWPRRELRQVFGRWRTSPIWIVAGLLLAPALHLAATSIEVALGGEPAAWFYPPARPEAIAALVFFSIGEEPGWRGFAYPRLAKRYGPVVGSLLLGVGWAIWHATMLVSPETGGIQLAHGAAMLIELPLYSVLFAWIFERGGRSLLVAFALHASGHLDNVYNAPDSELRLRALRLAILVIAAALAARSLSRSPRATA